MKIISLTLSLLSIIVQVYSQNHTETENLNFEDYERSYELFIPENYTLNKKYPVVFVLHGGGGTAKHLIRSSRARFNYLANRDRFIVVYPNGIQKSWNDGTRDTIGVARKLQINDVGFFKKILEDLTLKYSINQQHVFACGISNGGFMVQRLAYELSDKLKGIAVVAANLSKVQAEKKYTGKPVPILLINGTMDPLVPFNGGDVTVFNQKRGVVLSANETVEIWKRINACSYKAEVFTFADINKKDKCSAVKTVWQNPENPEIKTVEITIKNGGHSWPGTHSILPRRLVGNTNMDFNGCDEIWNFFKSLTQ